MAGGCRDCSRCTETTVWSLLALPYRATVGLVLALTVYPFRKRCPQCGHLMSQHRMVKAGEARLAD
jgi:hypothetical protein